VTTINTLSTSVRFYADKGVNLRVWRTRSGPDGDCKAFCDGETDEEGVFVWTAYERGPRSGWAEITPDEAKSLLEDGHKHWEWSKANREAQEKRDREALLERDKKREEYEKKAAARAARAAEKRRAVKEANKLAAEARLIEKARLDTIERGRRAKSEAQCRLLNTAADDIEGIVANLASMLVDDHPAVTAEILGASCRFVKMLRPHAENLK